LQALYVVFSFLKHLIGEKIAFDFLFFFVLRFHFHFRKTPVTLQEGEDFGRGEKFFHFACFDKIRQRNQNKVEISVVS
jgi:hypothetical protein